MKIDVEQSLISELQYNMMYTSNEITSEFSYIYFAAAHMHEKGKIQTSGNISRCREEFFVEVLYEDHVLQNKFIGYNKRGYFFLFVPSHKNEVRKARNRVRAAVKALHKYERRAQEELTTYEVVSRIKEKNKVAIAFLVRPSVLWSRSLPHFSLYLLLLRAFIKEPYRHGSLESYVTKMTKKYVNAAIYTAIGSLRETNRIYPVHKLLHIFTSPLYKDKLKHEPVDTSHGSEFRKVGLGSYDEVNTGISTITAQALILPKKEKLLSIVAESGTTNTYVKKQAVTALNRLDTHKIVDAQWQTIAYCIHTLHLYHKAKKYYPTQGELSSYKPPKKWFDKMAKELSVILRGYESKEVTI